MDVILVLKAKKKCWERNCLTIFIAICNFLTFRKLFQRVKNNLIHLDLLITGRFLESSANQKLSQSIICFFPPSFLVVILIFHFIFLTTIDAAFIHSFISDMFNSFPERSLMFFSNEVPQRWPRNSHCG